MANEKRLIDGSEIGVIRGTIGGKAKYCRIGIRRKPQQKKIEQSSSGMHGEDRRGVIAAMIVMKWFCETHDCDICPLHELNYEPGKGFPCAKLPMHWNCPDAIDPTVDAVEVVRCGNCKYFREPFCIRRDDETHRERINMLTVDFCSYGERR